MKALVWFVILFGFHACSGDRTNGTDAGSDMTPEGVLDHEEISTLKEDGSTTSDDFNPAENQQPENQAEVKSEVGEEPVGTLDPYSLGEFEVEHFQEIVDLDLDVNQERNIEVEVYVPKGSLAKPYPVVLLFHGFNLEASYYVSYGELLASYGFLAILPSMGDSMLDPLSHVQLAEDVKTLIDWLAQQNEDAGSKLLGLVDMEKIATSGHSRGGKQAIYGAIVDQRIKVVFTLDPVDAGPPIGNNEEDYPSVAPEMMNQLKIPTGYIGMGRGKEGTIPCSPEDENYHEFFIAAPSPAFEYAIPTGGHMDFLGDCGIPCLGCKKGDDPEWNTSFSKATLIAFLNVTLLKDERYRPWLDGEEVLKYSDQVVFASH